MDVKWREHGSSQWIDLRGTPHFLFSQHLTVDTTFIAVKPVGPHFINMLFEDFLNDFAFKTTESWLKDEDER